MAASMEKLCWVSILITFLLFTIHTASAIKCWECNSHYDKNCGDPFRNATFDITDCDQRELEHYPNQKAAVCRKIIQKVRNDYRTVRGCGYLSSEKENTDCFKRAGTFNVLLQYCSCDQDGCNASTWLRPAWAMALLGVMATTVLGKHRQ